MRAYLLMLMVVLIPAIAAFESGGLSIVFAAAANAFFLIAPIVLAVGSVIGLLSRRRA
jgi:hypothetical protein